MWRVGLGWVGALPVAPVGRCSFVFAWRRASRCCRFGGRSRGVPRGSGRALSLPGSVIDCPASLRRAWPAGPCAVGRRVRSLGECARGSRCCRLVRGKICRYRCGGSDFAHGWERCVDWRLGRSVRSGPAASGCSPSLRVGVSGWVWQVGGFEASAAEYAGIAFAAGEAVGGRVVAGVGRGVVEPE